MRTDSTIQGDAAPAFARRRALLALVALASGIAGADAGWVAWPAWASFAVAIVLAMVAAIPQAKVPARWSAAWMLAAMVFIGGGVYTLRVREAAAGYLADRWADLRPGERTLVTIEGVVVSGLERTGPQPGVLARFSRAEPGLVFTLRVDRSITDVAAPASGDVRCGLPVEADTPKTAETVAVGRRVRVTGLASPTRLPLNPGEASMARLSRQARSAGFVSVTSPELVVAIEHRSVVASAVGVARRAVDGVRGGAARVLLGVGEQWGEQAQATAAALLLGQNEPGLGEVRETFTRLGILHALAISGFHLSVLTFMAITTLRALTPGAGPGWIEPVAIGSLLILYATILPAQVPIARAVVMGLVMLGSESAGRRYDRITILLWVSGALLIWRPADLWSLGFQLSCGLTGLLLWLGTPAYTRLWGVAFVVPGVRTGGLVATIRHWVQASISSSVLCWLASVPVIGAQTGYFSPLAVVATVLVSPVLVLAMGAGYVVLIVSAAVNWAFPAVGDMGSWVVGLFASASVRLADLIDRAPGSGLMCPPIHPLAAALATASVVAFVALGRRRAWTGWMLVAAATGVCAVSIGLATRLPAGVTARIDTFAVGDGSCHLIRVGRDFVLWDAGSLQYAQARRVLPAALRASGAWRIKTAFVTHGDFDHFGVLPELAERFGMEQVFVGQRFLDRADNPESAAAAMLKRLAELGVRVLPVSAGSDIQLDGGVLRVLSPEAGQEFQRENDYSIVARLDVAPGSSRALALFTGDTQSAAITSVRDRYPELRADWVEAPHHGAASPEAADWVASLTPSMVVQSTGPQRMSSPAWHAVWDPFRDRFELFQTPVEGATFAEFSGGRLVRRGSYR